MSAHDPLEVDRRFVEAMNRADVEAVMALYGPDTVLVPAPGEPELRGLDQLRAFTRRFADARPRLNVELKQFVQADDVALCSVRWRLTGTHPNGEPLELSGTDANVVRRQPDGTWRTLIDNPFHDQHVGLVEPAPAGPSPSSR